jgi:hypothetical protein
MASEIAAVSWVIPISRRGMDGAGARTVQAVIDSAMIPASTETHLLMSTFPGEGECLAQNSENE